MYGTRVAVVKRSKGAQYGVGSPRYRLIQATITHQNSLLHLHFKEVCTFDFIGDS